jgi:hypothetical protein
MRRTGKTHTVKDEGEVDSDIDNKDECMAETWEARYLL